MLKIFFLPQSFLRGKGRKVGRTLERKDIWKEKESRQEENKYIKMDYLVLFFCFPVNNTEEMFNFEERKK